MEIGVGPVEKESEIGGGYPSQHRFYNTLVDGLKNQEMGESAKSLVAVEDPSMNAEGNIIRYKDIHMSPSKGNGVTGEIESEEEEGLSDNSLGLSAEVGEIEVRTIKQSNLNPPKSKGNLRGRKNRQRLLEEAGNMKGQTRLLRSGRDLFSPGQQ